MISALILAAVIAILLVTGFRRVPGIGVLGALAIIAALYWLRGDDFASRLGLLPPAQWGSTLAWSAALGIVIQLFSTTVIEPAADRLTRSRTDHSLFESIRGNLRNLLLSLAAVWLVVALVEEIIFRGYLLGELAILTGTSRPAQLGNLLLTSAVFGLAHWYQGRSGALSTGLLGLVLGGLYAAAGYNLWLPVLTHGFIDTVGLVMLYAGLDRTLKEQVRIIP
jgi:membrane protease YdiL (CAAX protease family)